MPDFDVYDEQEAAERRQMYEDRVREAIDTLNVRLDEQRAESERLRGLLVTARAELSSIADFNGVLPHGMRISVGVALHRSDPDAAAEDHAPLEIFKVVKP